MTSTKKVLLLVLIIFIFLAIRQYVPVLSLFFNNWFISPFTYGILLFIAIKLFPAAKRNREAKNKRSTIFILSFIYVLVFILLGLVVEFVRNAFWNNWLAMFEDLFKVISIIVIQEIIRNRVITNLPKKHRWIFYLLIMIAFYLWDVNMRHLITKFSTIEFLFPDFAIALFIQGFLCYLSLDAGLDSVLINRIVIVVIFHITPIYADVDWFFKGMYDLIMYIIFCFVIGYESLSLNRDTRREVIKKSNPLVYVILLVILIFLVAFQLGFFVYAPTAIVTNSMKPVFIRGDAVIVKKINEKTIHELKIGDIIEYKMGNRSVVHRIVDIDKSDEDNWVFQTQGDYNNGPDKEPVTEAQVKGVVKLTVPWIGYPSVYFIEYFDQGGAPAVETGGD